MPGPLLYAGGAVPAAAVQGGTWRLVTDRVMGGRSDGRLVAREVQGEPAICLSGRVRLDNRGGFVQMALDLSPTVFDASPYSGVALRVLGNGEQYGLHLKTRGLSFPWQSYRQAFVAPPRWTELRLPFLDFLPYRTRVPMDISGLCRLGLVAIGRAFEAELCVARVGLY